MKKELKDYLHLYPNCEMTNNDEDFLLEQIHIDGFTTSQKEFYQFGSKALPKMKLRPMPDMTEDESPECNNLFFNCKFTLGDYQQMEAYARLINWLRKNFFDVDGLIESGLAIDKTTVKK